MFTLAIIAILIIGTLVGLRRGFILQLIHLTGFIMAFIVARVYYSELAPKLTMWIPYPNLGGTQELVGLLTDMNVEDAYYRAIAFVGIFFVVRILLQIIGSMLDFIASLPVLRSLNRIGGGALGFVEVYLLVFILLYIAALLPIPTIQEQLTGSFLAEGMVEHTPFISNLVKELWLS